MSKIPYEQLIEGFKRLESRGMLVKGMTEGTPFLIIRIGIFRTILLSTVF
jgi:hypothetical protein